MKNLKSFGQLNEADGDSGKMLGFALSLTTWDRKDCSSYMIMGVAPTFYEFAGQFFEDMTGMNTSEYEEGGDQEYLKDVYNLIETYAAFDQEQRVEYVFWSGLEPKVNEHMYDSEKLENPVNVMVKLEKYFTNSRLVMAKYPTGNEGNMKYIADSVEKDPEKFELYDDKEQESIVSASNWDAKKKEALQRYGRIKSQF
jgi:hypothetical protein